VGNNFCAPAPFTGVVSRKTHGTAGDFDVALPIVGNAGIEPRSGGQSKEFKLIYSYNKTITAAGSATLGEGTATLGTPTLGPGANQVTVNLTNVNNLQRVMVSLNNVQFAGGVLNDLNARMDVL